MRNEPAIRATIEAITGVLIKHIDHPLEESTGKYLKAKEARDIRTMDFWDGYSEALAALKEIIEGRE